MAPLTRYPHLCLSVLSLLLMSVTTSADERFSTGEPTTRWLAAYSLAAGLGPLGSQGPELRVWIDNVMFGEVHGLVISQSSIVECDTNWKITGSVETVKSARCKKRPGPNRRLEALMLLGDLSKLNGKELDCGVQDGADVFVEGKDTTATFAFFAGNPQECNDQGSILVTRLLKMLDH